ncbi:hypothetical protein [Bradyrhizobium cytisi]|nr:hypothetical protein [Bradyrhizobium cytisi]
MVLSPIILQPGPAALTDRLDAIVMALWGERSSIIRHCERSALRSQ